MGSRRQTVKEDAQTRGGLLYRQRRDGFSGDALMWLSGDDTTWFCGDDGAVMHVSRGSGCTAFSSVAFYFFGDELSWTVDEIHRAAVHPGDRGI